MPLPWVDADLSASTVNRKLSAVSTFYEFHQRRGAEVGDLLARWRPGGRGGSWRPFLAHLGDRPERRRVIALRSERRLPRELSAVEMTRLIDACDRLRDRFLLSLLRGTGLRVGEALGLRHEDIDALRRVITVRQRLNVNRARAKTFSREVPADAALIRLYSDYLHEEYGSLDCDYVFVTLWAEPVGRPMSYPSVDRLVRRLRQQTGIEFTPHQFRHSYAADLQAASPWRWCSIYSATRASARLSIPIAISASRTPVGRSWRQGSWTKAARHDRVAGVAPRSCRCQLAVAITVAAAPGVRVPGDPGRPSGSARSAAKGAARSPLSSVPTVWFARCAATRAGSLRAIEPAGSAEVS